MSSTNVKSQATFSIALCRAKRTTKANKHCNLSLQWRPCEEVLLGLRNKEDRQREEMCKSEASCRRLRALFLNTRQARVISPAATPHFSLLSVQWHSVVSLAKRQLALLFVRKGREFGAIRLVR